MTKNPLIGMLGWILAYSLLVLSIIKALDWFPFHSLLIVGVMTIGFLAMDPILPVSTIDFKAFRVNLFGYTYWFIAGYLLNVRYRGAEISLQEFNRDPA